jgi:hypothetical protein
MPPAIPIIAAAATAYGGAVAIGAGASIIGGMMIAGAAFSTVGALTGNKDLSRFGMVLGLAGGVASLASGASSAAAGEIAAEAGEQGATSAATEALGQTAATTATETTGGAALAESAAPGAADLTGAAASEAAPAAVGGAADAGVAAGAPGVADAGAATAGAAVDTGAALAGPQIAPVAGGYTPGAGFTPDTGILSSQNPSLFDQIGSAVSKGTAWVDKNPALAKIGAGIIQGGAQAYGAHQQAQAIQDNLAAQQAYADKIRQRYSDSVRNLQIPTYARPAPNPNPGIIGNGMKGQ